MDDCSLYLILEGKVDIFLHNRSGKERKNGEDYTLSELTKGKYFGEYSFFSGRERIAGAKASSYCTLARVKREDFLQSLEYFHEDFEKFKQIQDEINFNSNYSSINLNCTICQNKWHLAKNCNTVKIQPYPTTIINAYNRPIE
jgi:CRP-like cAMP-binding protein